MAGSKPSENPRINRLIELEVDGRIKPEHQKELDTYRAQGIAPRKTVGAGTEGERKASAFLSRALGANRDYEKTGVGPRNIVTQNIQDKFPNLSNTLINSDQRQVADSSQDEFIAASLRQDSGAAIPTEELEKQRRIYFPMPGDNEAVIKQKRMARLRAIDGLVQSAGSGLTATQKAALESMKDDMRAAVAGDAPAGAAPGEAAQPATSTATQLSVGVNPLEQAVERAAGPSQADNQAAFEAEFRDAYAKGADRAALLAIGQKYQIAPNEKELDAALAARAGGDARLNITGSPPPSGGTPAAPPKGRGQGGIMETADAAVRGAADTASLGLSDEIAAIGNTILDPTTTLRDNLDRERATDRYDEANNFGARLTGQIAGGLALPMGAARSPAALGRVGAAYGGAYGFGSAEGNIIERLPNAALGAAGGGAFAYGLGAGAQALGRRLARGGTSSTGATAPVALMEAADRLGVQPMPADVGGAMTRRLTSAAAQAPISAIPITRAGERVTEQALGARDRIAAGVGQVVEPELAGETARAGAKAFITRTGSVGRAQYEKAERMAGLARVVPTKTIDALDRNIAELSQAPGGSQGVAALEALKAEIAAKGTVSVAGVRAMRTTLRDGFIKDGLRGSDLERRVNQVIDAASQDLVDSLTSGGRPEAARAFAVADRYWRNRLRTIDETLEPIIGKDGAKSGEQIVASLQQAARGNASRLGAFVRALPAEESAVVRATLIGQLGRASAGAQDAAGSAFSLPQFLTHWNQMTPGAKRALFDPASMSALNDLARIAQGSKQASRFANTSNTAGGVVGQTIVTGAVGALFDMGTMAAALASQYGAGRLLASPRFARWLARAPKARDPEAHMEKLSEIAAKEAAIAPEILGFQQRLTDALVKEPARLRAAEQNDE